MQAALDLNRGGSSPLLRMTLRLAALLDEPHTKMLAAELTRATEMERFSGRENTEALEADPRPSRLVHVHMEAPFELRPADRRRRGSFFWACYMSARPESAQERILARQISTRLRTLRGGVLDALMGNGAYGHPAGVIDSLPGQRLDVPRPDRAGRPRPCVRESALDRDVTQVRVHRPFEPHVSPPATPATPPAAVVAPSRRSSSDAASTPVARMPLRSRPSRTPVTASASGTHSMRMSASSASRAWAWPTGERPVARKRCTTSSLPPGVVKMLTSGCQSEATKASPLP